MLLRDLDERIRADDLVPLICFVPAKIVHLGFALRSRRFCLLVVAVALVFSACSGSGAKRSGLSGSSRYSHTMHNRFYEAWVQPKIVGAPLGKVSVPVDVRIDPRGRVLSFKPARLTGYRRIDESIAAVGRRVRRVTPPPVSEGEFKLRIYFELDVKR